MVGRSTRGQVGSEQLIRLEQLLAQLGDGLRILVTHYPILLAGGRLEKPWRRLRDWQRLVKIAIAGGIKLWLHGHRHAAYQLPPTLARPFGQICVGSATQTDRWSYHEYVVEEKRILVQRRTWSPGKERFEDAGMQEMRFQV